MNTQTKLFAAGAGCGVLAALPVPPLARLILIVLGVALNGVGFWRYASHPEEGASF